ncbi:MAG: gamma-glutamyltransferase family protein [Acidobacteriota bacterium]
MPGGPTRRDVIAGAVALGAAACAGRKVVMRKTSSGMVATTQWPATDAGLEILRAGGTAADAAIAAAAALAVTEPMMTGLGGDCFALHYAAATGKITALNGSGRSPAALTLDAVSSRGFTQIPDTGGLPVTVPGACAGWADLIAAHGKLSLARVLEPAIRLAEEGFAVGKKIAFAWERGADRLLAAPGKGWALLVEGRAPVAGEHFKNPALARALREVARGGKDAFYQGPIADAIVRTVKESGGVMELADLAAHASTWVEPISTTYRGRRIWECPPNGQGLVPLLALNILEGYDLHAMVPLGPQRLHLVAEALRLAFADARWFIGDPEHAAIPVAELLAKSYAARRRALIDPARAQQQIVHGEPRGRSDTTYLCAVDADGNACSFINSNFDLFGSGLVPGASDRELGWGFALQDRGASFVLEPGHPDMVGPRKRPYHTIIPGMITHPDGSLYGPFGVMGGFMQPQGHVQVVTALLDDNLAPQTALDQPRLCVHARDGGAVWPSDASAVDLLLEHGIAAETAGALAAMGHTVKPDIDGPRRLVFGRGQIIRVERDGTLAGGSDLRGDGYAGSTDR